MYFVHSYYVQPNDESVVLATTTYGDQQYCSAIKQNNLLATQFHPEKSGAIGMKIYEQLKNQLTNQ
jgi:glutamine amidotransferase